MPSSSDDRRATTPRFTGGGQHAALRRTSLVPTTRYSLLLGTTLAPTERVSNQNASRGGGGPTMLFEYHFPMIADDGRNDAFAAAIGRAVMRFAPSLVLDIGCGSGLLAVFAARAGAPRVLALDMTRELAQVAQGVVRKHELQSRVHVLPIHSSELTLADAPTLQVCSSPVTFRLSLPRAKGVLHLTEASLCLPI